MGGSTVGGEYWKIVTEKEFDYDEANQTMMDAIRQDISENKHITVQLFMNKLTISWQDQDYLYFAWETMAPDDRIHTQRLDQQIFYQSYYLIIGVLAVMGCWTFVREKPNKFFFSIALFILGFMLTLLLSENQPRYKIITYPYICILAGVGAHYFVKQIENRKGIRVRNK